MNAARGQAEHRMEIRDIVAQRYGRRAFLQGLGAIGAGAALGPGLGRAATTPSFGFTEISHGIDATHHVAPGYTTDIVIRWGDPVLPGAPPFDPQRQSAAAQALQFGFNCDFIGFAPLPLGSGAPARGLLCVNHEYTSARMMFPQTSRRRDDRTKLPPRAQVDVEMAAHGASIIEIARGADAKWRTDPASRFNRRITATTPMRIAGPAAGHARLRTTADPSGTRVLGMVGNCAGGMTPWGTFLSGEENFHGYFITAPQDPAEARNHARYGVPGRFNSWGGYYDRFDPAKEPREPNRFGWVVEIDPYDPTVMPVKRTALGRLKHEGATCVVNRDGRMVVYMGDDDEFEYVYRFVSRGRFDAADRAGNRDLLDEGVLSVARFAPDGTVRWLPLVHGQGPFNATNGFASQADIAIETRRAADLAGATRMDRPEDIEADPQGEKVYVVLTRNLLREEADAANPRVKNLWGHIIEMTPPDGDHSAEAYRWDILVAGGDPADSATNAKFHAATSRDGWFAGPDNIAFDPDGRLWVATDQGGHWAQSSGSADGLFAVETAGARRGAARMFFRCPVGAEPCGPCFAPDGRALFLSIQHPGADGTKAWAPFGRESSFDDPATRWPDFVPHMPPRPSVVVVTKDDGGKIGG